MDDSKLLVLLSLYVLPDVCCYFGLFSIFVFFLAFSTTNSGRSIIYVIQTQHSVLHIRFSIKTRTKTTNYIVKQRNSIDVV